MLFAELSAEIEGVWHRRTRHSFENQGRAVLAARAFVENVGVGDAAVEAFA